MSSYIHILPPGPVMKWLTFSVKPPFSALQLGSCRLQLCSASGLCSALVSAIRAVRLKEEEAHSVLSASWSRECHPSHTSSLQQWQFLPRAVTESNLQLPQHLESALWSGPPGPQPAAGFAESASHSPGGSETPAPASSIHSSEVQVSVPWGLPSWLLSFNNVTSSLCFLSPGGGS